MMTIQTKLERFEVLGVKFSAINMPEACAVIDEVIARRDKGYVCVCPVSTIMECQKDENFRRIVNSATLVTPDGMPSVWLGRMYGYKNIARVYGPDLLLAVCEMSSRKGYKNYFYGGTPEVLEKLALNLTARFPGLKICGTYAPPFRELTEAEDKKIVEEINSKSPDVIWVGLGSPKQDLWIDQHRGQINAPMMLAVGAAFDFLSGTKPQAPKWMQQAGLEWFFRLCCEPQRLWRRYLIGNTQFLYLLFKNFLFKGAVKKP